MGSVLRHVNTKFPTRSEKNEMFPLFKLIAVVSFLSVGSSVPTSKGQCPSGWTASSVVSNKCYKAGSSALSWPDGEKACQAAAPGGHMIAIHSAFENQLIHDIAVANQIAGCELWLGCMDKDDIGVYKWTDGSEFDWYNWRTNGPDTHGVCAKLYIENGQLSTLWTQDECPTAKCYICEMFLQ